MVSRETKTSSHQTAIFFGERSYHSKDIQGIWTSFVKSFLDVDSGTGGFDKFQYFICKFLRLLAPKGEAPPAFGPTSRLIFLFFSQVQDLDLLNEAHVFEKKKHNP